MERQLPIITIEGTDFIVDITQFVLREKAVPTNVIVFEDMQHLGDSYHFDYNIDTKNVPNIFNKKSITVKIPEFVVLDPIGMADKYKCTVDDLKNKSDFEIIVDQKSFDLRVMKGMLPTVEIAGHPFYVDIPMDKLRPKDDFLSKGIVFSDIEGYYDSEKRTYTIPYNPKTHEFQEPDYLNLKELPKDLIFVKFPSERLLDRIGWNRKYGFEMTHGLFRNGLKLHFLAKNVPFEKTFLVDLIQSNLKAEKSNKEQTSINSKQSKQKRLNM